MALNFPPVNSADDNPTNGMIWTAPNGYQWQYDESVPGWKSLAPTGNSNIVYRGGLDLTQDPDTQYNDIVSGNQFVVTTGASPVDAALYPGLGGENIAEGQIVIYDGNEWQYINNVPYATETVQGVVELATQAEAEAGVDNRVVLTPLRGKQLIDVNLPVQATTSAPPGITRYATQAEANLGTETQAALTPASINALLDRIEQLEADTVHAGMIMWVGCRENLIPQGWLFCDGSLISNSGSTARLYQTLKGWGNPWGPSATSSTVRVPDLRGRFIRGYHAGSGRDPLLTEFGGSQNDSFEKHDHKIDDPGHDHDIKGYPSGSPDKNTDRKIIDKGWRQPQADTKTTLDAKTNIKVLERGAQETKPKNLNLTPVIKL